MSEMGNGIKITLLELGKKQVDLLDELRKRGYKRLHPSQLSEYINGRQNSPQAYVVKDLIYKILDEWKAERKEG